MSKLWTIPFDSLALVSTSALPAKRTFVRGAANVRFPPLATKYAWYAISWSQAEDLAATGEGGLYADAYWA